MTETGWKCKKCETFNQPDDKVCNCGAKKPSFLSGPILYVAIGGVVLIILLGVLIVKMVGMPEEKYREAVVKVYKDQQISEEERMALATVQKQWNITDEKAKTIMDEIVNKGVKNPPPPPHTPKHPTPEQKEIARLLVSDGLKLAKENNIQAALEKFKLATENNWESDQAFGNLGAALLHSGKPDDALQASSKAASLKPDNPMWHLNLAELYSMKDNKDSALAELEAAITNGFKDTAKLKSFDFKNIENEPKFKELVARMR